MAEFWSGLCQTWTRTLFSAWKFAGVSDQKRAELSALAAIPRMLPANAGARRKALAAIRAVVSADGEVTGERAKRLARIEAILGEPVRAGMA
jgi:hypothetical protein